MPGAVLLAYAGGHLWGSAVGKVRTARRLLAAIPWRGDERVLDVGCGHGLFLIDAARRLTTGRAVGIDIWSQKDQWHNSPSAVVENLRRAGLIDRAYVSGADGRHLPFPDATFDVVVSSLVIHNIPGAENRERALHEIVRVLKPGGRIVIVDLAQTARYARHFQAEGLSECPALATDAAVLPRRPSGHGSQGAVTAQRLRGWSGQFGVVPTWRRRPAMMNMSGAMTVLMVVMMVVMMGGCVAGLGWFTRRSRRS